MPVHPSGAAVIRSDTLAASPHPPKRFVVEPPPGTVIAPRVLATSARWARPVRTPAQPMRKFRTADELLRSCPSEAEMEQIRYDFNIYFAPKVAAPWSCTEGGSESSVMLSVYNIFRLFWSLDFDAPLPIIGVTNAYAWLRSLGLSWYFRPAHPPDDALNHAAGTVIVLNSDGLGAPFMRRMVDPQSGNGISGMLPLIVHEARHTDPGGGPKGHTCSRYPGTGEPGASDTGLAYNGAYALEYWFERWMAEHTGTFLSTAVREMYAYQTAVDWHGPDSAFCDQYHPALKGDEQDAAFWWQWLGWLDSQGNQLSPSIQREWPRLSPQQRLSLLGVLLAGRLPGALRPQDFPYAGDPNRWQQHVPVDLEARRRLTALAENHGAVQAVAIIAQAITNAASRPAPSVAVPLRRTDR